MEALSGELTADGHDWRSVLLPVKIVGLKMRCGSEEQLPQPAATWPSLSSRYVLNICSRLLQSCVKKLNKRTFNDAILLL